MKYVEPFGLSEREKRDKKASNVKETGWKQQRRKQSECNFFDVGIFLQSHASLKFFFFFGYHS